MGLESKKDVVAKKSSSSGYGAGIAEENWIGELLVVAAAAAAAVLCMSAILTGSSVSSSSDTSAEDDDAKTCSAMEENICDRSVEEGSTGYSCCSCSVVLVTRSAAGTLESSSGEVVSDLVVASWEETCLGDGLSDALLLVLETSCTFGGSTIMRVDGSRVSRKAWETLAAASSQVISLHTPSCWRTNLPLIL